MQSKVKEVCSPLIMRGQHGGERNRENVSEWGLIRVL